jgi:hypothetical protein
MATKFSSVLIILLLISWHAGLAKENKPAATPNTAMLEMLSCNYIDDHGPADLNTLATTWNEWADENNSDPYSAWVWTPFYFNDTNDSDFVWLGLSPNAAALGRGHDQLLTSGEAVLSQLNRIASCKSHYNYAAINFRAAPHRDDPSTAVIAFTGCDIVEGKTFADASIALESWTDFVTDVGSNRGMWILRRAFGSGDDEADFRWVNTFPDHESLGDDYDRFRKIGGSKARELFGDVFKCGITTVYNSKALRHGIEDGLYQLN